MPLAVHEGFPAAPRREPARAALARALLAASALVASGGTALAQSCTFTVGSATLGPIDVTAGASTASTTTFSANCNGERRRRLVVCPHIGPGSGGAGSNGNPRQMVNGANILAFNLFQDPSYATVWGSLLHGWSSSAPPRMEVTLGANGRGQASRTMYIRVPGSQNTAPPGSYSSSFSGANVQVRYAYEPTTTSITDCASVSGGVQGTASFTVAAAVSTNCTVSATEIDFGATGVIQSARDGVGNVSVVCTRNAPYTIGLNGGLTGAANPAQRRMRQGVNGITYGLYRDAARAQPWGSTPGSNTVSGTGTGATQSFPVYGRVPVQPTPPVGLYSDTVSVTITY